MNAMGSLEKVLMPLAEKIGKNKYLISIRDGFLVSSPLLIVGSLFLLIAKFQQPAPRYFLLDTGLNSHHKYLKLPEPNKILSPSDSFFLSSETGQTIIQPEQKSDTHLLQCQASVTSSDKFSEHGKTHTDNSFGTYHVFQTRFSHHFLIQSDFHPLDFGHSLKHLKSDTQKLKVHQVIQHCC